MVSTPETISNGFPPGKRFVSLRPEKKSRSTTETANFGYLIRLPNATVNGQLLPNRSALIETEAGRERTFTFVAALVDTNVLVYRFDKRFPQKQQIATDILRRGIDEGSIRVPHQAIVEFVAAVTRPLRGYVILKQSDALREAEEFLKQFTVVYPNEIILRNAMRGCAAYQLSWFDAQIWSYAEYYGLAEIVTEDLQHDRIYGTVRVLNPFFGLQK